MTEDSINLFNPLSRGIILRVEWYDGLEKEFKFLQKLNSENKIHKQDYWNYYSPEGLKKLRVDFKEQFKDFK